MDVLSDVLSAIRLTGAVFFDVERRAPWVAATPQAESIAHLVMPDAEHVIMFHVVIEGRCWAEILHSGAKPQHLVAGDIIVLPMGDSHVLCSEPGMRVAPDFDRFFRPPDQQLPFLIGSNGGTGEQTHFVCGYLGCDARPFNPLLRSLPRLMHVTAAASNAPVLQLFRMATEETAMHRSGGETVLAKLAELLFVDALRRHIDGLPQDAIGWLSGLRDAQIGAALALLHGRPTENWTVVSLAREVGLSRSAFADRFMFFMQDSPMHYLARWRMQLATHLLGRQGASVSRVAAEVGYESEAAFNRAFKKYVGVPPGSWRKTRSPATGHAS